MDINLIKINEPKSPIIGDEVVCILKQIESYYQSVTPDRVFENGKFVNYTGPIRFVQWIRVYVIFSNGSSFEDKSNTYLPEQDKSNFPKEGYFEKHGQEWKCITQDVFYKKFK